MKKRLVICCDGTWNSLKQPVPTNVARVWDVVPGEAADGVRQLTCYHEGVGAGLPWLGHLAGGAFGWGLSANVRKAYEFVVENYVPGDELFFFGFSRGAYTARSTVGFIRNCGVLRPEHAGRIGEAYRLYRNRDEATGPDSPDAVRFREEHAHEDVTPIRFLGVWDTVGALGIPLSGGRWLHRLNRRWQFHDMTLSSTVQSAFQALAVDEHRKSYVPAVWKPSRKPAEQNQEREQVWFAGAHSDVGGGYREHALSDIALRWLASRAERCGLAFDPGAFGGPAGANAEGTLHDSLNGFFRLFGSADRPIGEKDAPSESLASSVLDRHRAMVYSPANLVTYLEGSPKITTV
ncbi:DUF2235 domain-containing protein [Amycolatopsis mongoliensis]|uniref:DUF2235 domain-containing protein n=1 Tax=Amycolatopsis mongoliensis TaxID=715475 RepID=A0A9Y2K0B7_9PSEU|nr:DUF2235 domain-containing protein [Amycolatopsis sp. 4-36]WIY06567.1 DUF2235 domain-containing protein [Amycolatopsis sp. 4-36]